MKQPTRPGSPPETFFVTQTSPTMPAFRPRLCFVSYRPLSELARPVLERYRDRAEIEVIDGIFGNALELARSRERVGDVDAFVSAGANAMTLRAALRTPVATIRVDGYDILTALLRARQLSDRVGVVTYREVNPRLDAVKDLLRLDVAQRAYGSAPEAEACFRELASQGYTVIVGSSIVVELAQRMGLSGILAYSENSVVQGIDAAIELARVARLETARTEQLHAVLDNLQEAVLAVDAAHRVVAANPAMEQLLARSHQSMLGVELDSLEPALSLADTLRTGIEQRGGVLQFARRDWIVHRTPIRERGQVLGAVITLYDARSIADADSTLRSQSRTRGSHVARYTMRDLLGASPIFLRARDAALRFAANDLTVLITGESGTGKELFAQAIHRAGGRADRPFVAMNCSAFPDALLESELFGHDEGAFTGARRGGRRGLIEAAHTGTLFLDEIGDMPMPLQTRLLRVLQERELVRLGGSAPIPVDVRVIAATHQDLRLLIAQKRFRADLFYRLNILALRVPPLRERGPDILQLARHLLAQALARLRSEVSGESALNQILPRLLSHAWPGNVRELENVCERLAVHLAFRRNAQDVDAEEFAYEFPELFAAEAPRENAQGPSTPAPRDRAVDAWPVDNWPERLAEALQACGGNRRLAAERLGISRATLWRRMRDSTGPARAS